MYRRNWIRIAVLLLLFPMVGCTPRPDVVTVTPAPTLVSLGESYKLVHERQPGFKNALSLTVEIVHLEISPQNDDLEDRHKISLVATFENTSDVSLVWRKPITYGFYDEMQDPNDLEIGLEAQGSHPLTVSGSSNYPSKAGRITVPEITRSDFLTLEPGEVFSFSMELALPLVYVEGTGYGGKVPPGRYKLMLGYRNVGIGYELPLTKTPPAPFESMQARDEWYDANIMYVDLNAWVGQVLSSEVEFTIPAE